MKLRDRYCCLLLLFLLAGCGPDPAPSPSPDASGTPSVSGTSGSEQSQTGSGGESSGGTGRVPSSSGSASSSSSSSGGADSVSGNGSKPDAESPAEWRRKHARSRPFRDFKHLEGYQEVRLVSPQPISRTNVESGKKLYETACAACHKVDGSPVNTDPTLVRFNMANLSVPHQYKYGSEPKAVFRSIAFGCPAPPMGGSKELYSKQEMWDIVNYIQSIQKR